MIRRPAGMVRVPRPTATVREPAPVQSAASATRRRPVKRSTVVRLHGTMQLLRARPVHVTVIRAWPPVPERDPTIEICIGVVRRGGPVVVVVMVVVVVVDVVVVTVVGALTVNVTAALLPRFSG